MAEVIKLIFICAVLCVICISAFSLYAAKLGLVDTPCERKTHKGSVPLIGGLSIYIAFTITCVFSLDLTPFLKLFLISGGLMVFIGVLDDKYALSVRSRIIGQVLISSILVLGVGVYIDSLGNIFYFFHLDLGKFGVLFTFIAILASINAFNMIDGIDGLLGATAIVSFVSLLIFAAIGSHILLLSLSGLMVVCLACYMPFNLGILKKKHKKIFMGDAGSMFIGFAVIVFSIIALGKNTEDSLLRPVTVLYILALPLMDMTSIMFRRIRKGQSPFKADREHIHHIFLRAGLTDRQALVFLLVVSTAIMLIGVVSELYKVPELVMLLIFLVLFLLYNCMIVHAWKIVTFVRKFKDKKYA